MKEITIKQNREQLKKVLSASALMVIISIVCFFFDGSFYKMAAIAGTCFFGICFFYVLKLYLHPKKMFILNGEGFYDYTMFPGMGTIPWENIRDASLEVRDERKYLCLKCVDLEDKIRALPAAEEKVVYRNLKSGLEPISFLVEAADHKPEEIRILIMNYKDEALKIRRCLGD